MMQIAAPARTVHQFEILRVLWLMSRPSHLLLIGFVYLVGSAMALSQGAALDTTRWLFALAPLILLSISVHYANEYADYETDSLTIRTPFSGGSGALPSSELSPMLALRAARLSLMLGGTLAGYGFARGWISPAAMAVLAGGTFLGWMYSLPPLALAWRGWGELDNAIAGGMALPLFGYTVLAGGLDIPIVAGCLPFVALVYLNLLVTNWPDRQADAAVGKNTLAVRWPTARLRRLYWGVAAGFVGLMPLLIGWSLPPIVAWTSYLVLPLIALGGLSYTRRTSPLAAVAAMVCMAFVQFMAWASTIT